MGIVPFQKGGRRRTVKTKRAGKELEGVGALRIAVRSALLPPFPEKDGTIYASFVIALLRGLPSAVDANTTACYLDTYQTRRGCGSVVENGSFKANLCGGRTSLA